MGWTRWWLHRACRGIVSASWAAITVLNWAWVCCLWCHRSRNDHSWLLPFAGLYAITDLIGYVVSPRSIGGLELVPLYVTHHDVWIAAAVAMWLSWFAAPALTAVKLWRGRVDWRWWVGILVPLLALSLSEMLGASTTLRRQLMHYLYEPAVLLVTAYCLAMYIATKVRRGEFLDFLSFAVAWTAVLLGLKILLLLDRQFRYSRLPSRAFFFIYAVLMVTVYLGWPRMRRWLSR